PKDGCVELELHLSVHKLPFPRFEYRQKVLARRSRSLAAVRVSASRGKNLRPQRLGGGSPHAPLRLIDEPPRLLRREAASPVPDDALAHEVRHAGRPLA